jgi:hypothetical protein
MSCIVGNRVRMGIDNEVDTIDKTWSTAKVNASREYMANASTMLPHASFFQGHAVSSHGSDALSVSV